MDWKQATREVTEGEGMYANLDTPVNLFVIQVIFQDERPYFKSSLTLTLNEWRFNWSFSRVSFLFLNSWRVSAVSYYVITHLPAIQKQHWHSREAPIEPPLIECECEWAFRIRAEELIKTSELHIYIYISGVRTRVQKVKASLRGRRFLGRP